MNEKYLIGIDIGGTKIYGGLVTPNGEIITTLKVPTPPKATAKIILTVLDKMLRELLYDGRASWKNILGLGVAVPGIVDNSGHVVITPNINLSNTALKQILNKKYRVPVTIGNDVNFGVLGEKWLGAGRKAKNIVGIFPGTGVGGGIIINNAIVPGTHGAAAELGHMIVDPKGPKCTCGNTGCLEAVAGRWAIERDLRAELRKGRKSILTDLAGNNLRRIKSSTLAKALKARDPLTLQIMTKAADALGQACVSLNHIFDPDLFLFGGGVIEACGEFFLPHIEKALKADPFFARLSTPRVVAARLGDDAVMLGAVAAMRTVLGIKDGESSYYPIVRLLAKNRLSVRGKVLTAISFIRADGKLREPKEDLSLRLSLADMEEICRKGPDVLFMTKPTGKTIAISPKGIRFLKKKRILPRILPQRQAVEAYNACGDRKAILIFP